VSEVPVLEDLPPVEGKRVLVRVDFNVPMRDGEITDDLRIRSALPTLSWLQERGATVTACSHLGRPKGSPDPKYSMVSVRARLDELLPGIELLENLRFDPGEEANDPRFVAQLVSGQDLYVNDAFGASHRAHASIVGPPATLPSAAGRLLQKEVEVLGGLRSSPRRPFVAVLGGAKVSDKLGVIDALLGIVDRLLIGGGMCFTFLAALGNPVGDSICETDEIDTCRRLLDQHGAAIVLPVDITALAPDGREVRQLGRSIPDGWRGLDIGPGTAAEFDDAIREARTVFWNGPMGLFEDDRFAAGTRAVAQSLADARAFTVVGGGDSAAAIAQFGLDGEIDHVSTGGGASLELLELGDLPGLAALRGAPNAGQRPGPATG
jgi:phosphoglycerate kinase